MTTDKVEECNCPAEADMPIADKCAAGEEYDQASGKCVAKVMQSAEETIPSWVKDLQTSYASISGKLEKLTALEQSAGVREIPKPTATVSNVSGQNVTMQTLGSELGKAFSEGRDLKLTIPYESVRELAVSSTNYGKHGIKESFKPVTARKHQIQEVGYTLSGTHTAIDQAAGVQTVPGGNDFAPLRQYTNYKSIPKGKDSATFYKKTLPDILSQTPGTTATQSTVTFTAVNIQPSTISGSYFLIDSDDEEDVPYGIASEVVDSIGQTVVDFEDNAIANTASAVGTLTPGLWINGNTGATITHSDIASMTLDPSAVGIAMRYLRNQGYLNGGVKPVLFAHPKAVDELIRDSDLTNFTQFSNDNIYKTGVFPELFGCTIVPTNSVAQTDNTTNDVYHNLMVIPGISFGSASKRDLNVKFHEIPENNQIAVTANWRYKAGVIDASSIVRISTAQ